MKWLRWRCYSGFGELVRNELFSYASYIQRLTARCKPGLLCSEVNIGMRLHWASFDRASRRMAHGIVTSCGGSRYIAQRRVMLYGVRARSTPEESNGREMRREVRLVFPEIFNPGTSLVVLSPCFTADVLHRARRNRKRTFVTSVDLFHIVRCTAVPAGQNNPAMVFPITPETASEVWPFFVVALFIFIVVDRSLLDNPLTHVFVKVYCVAVDLMAQVKCCRAMLEVSRT